MPKEWKTSLQRGPKSIGERRIEVRTLPRFCGLSGAQIVTKTGYSRTFVYRQLAGMKEGKSVHYRPRIGRPKRIFERVRDRIVKMCKGKHGMSTRRVAAIPEGQNMKLAKEGVRLMLRANDLTTYRQAPKPLVTKVQRKRRLAFAEAHRRRNWTLTLLTDEKHFALHGSANRKNDVI